MGYHKVDDRIHAIPTKVLPNTIKDFYSRMDFRCNHKNKSWWKHEKLASEFQVARRTIIRWCRQLESLGMIENRRTGRSNEMSVIKLTDDDYRKLGVPEEVILKCQEDTDVTSDATPVSHQMRHPCRIGIKGKDKTKKKTGGSATQRKTVGEIYSDPQVVSSGKRAVESSSKKKKHTVPSPESMVPLESLIDDLFPEVDEQRLSSWTKKVWTKEFVSKMNKAGYEVAFQGYTNTLADHVGAIRNHLLNRGFSRLKIYRFLLKWFPEAYPDICEAEFKKDPEDFMFSVSWMEPRLSRLVALYEKEVGDSEEEDASDRLIVD